MQRDSTHALSDRQFAMMRVLWERDEATVAEVQEALDRSLAITTVATMRTRLEKRGVVSRRAEGRQFVYRAAVAERDVRQTMVSELMERLFQGDAAALVNHLVREGEIEPDELAELKQRIDADREKGGRDEH